MQIVVKSLRKEEEEALLRVEHAYQLRVIKDAENHDYYLDKIEGHDWEICAYSGDYHGDTIDWLPYNLTLDEAIGLTCLKIQEFFTEELDIVNA